MECTSTQATASKVSLLMLGQQAVIDAYLCLLHLTTGWLHLTRTDCAYVLSSSLLPQDVLVWVCHHRLRQHRVYSTGCGLQASCHSCASVLCLWVL